MLRYAGTVRELNFDQLMRVYIEGNEEKAHEAESFSLGLLEAEQDFYRYLDQVFFRTDGAVYAIWEEDGEYCSALRLEPYRDGLLLEALETAPDRRRKGYAKKLIEAVLADLQPEKVYSHISKKNHASIQTHLSCGFEKHLDYAVYVDGSVFHQIYTFLWQREAVENRKAF